MLRRNIAGEPFEIFTRLQQRVYHRHEQRLEAWNRAALPHFCLGY